MFLVGKVKNQWHYNDIEDVDPFLKVGWHLF